MVGWDGHTMFVRSFGQHDLVTSLSEKYPHYDI